MRYKRHFLRETLVRINNRFLVFFFIFYFQSISISYGFDCNDPVEVTKFLFEKEVMLKYEDAEKYICKEDKEEFELVVKFQELAIKEFKKQNFDFFKQAEIDLSTIKYRLLEVDDLNATVLVSGRLILKMNGKIIKNDDSRRDDIYNLKKENGVWVKCNN